MDGILEKMAREAADFPQRKLYNFLDCSQEPFGEHMVTTGQVWQRAGGIAAELLAKGAQKGDRAVILPERESSTGSSGPRIAGARHEEPVFRARATPTTTSSPPPHKRSVPSHVVL